MAINTTDFLASYPEFHDAPLSLVAAKLAEAVRLVPANQSIWNANGDPTRDLTEDATFLYCAHFLALSPYARHMALIDEKQSPSGGTLYWQRLQMLKRTVTSGFRVL